MSDTRPLIVTAGLAKADAAWATALRRAHFPPERNYLDAHLTMFHALPPSCEAEAKGRLAGLARCAPPKASIAGLISLGRGVAILIDSEPLKQMRGNLVDAFHGLLTAQDAGGWRPHITIQNKVDPQVAKATLRELIGQGIGEPRPLQVAGLELWRYDGGPWAAVARYPFRG